MMIAAVTTMSFVLVCAMMVQTTSFQIRNGAFKLAPRHTLGPSSLRRPAVSSAGVDVASDTVPRAMVLNPLLQSLTESVSPGKLSLAIKSKVLNLWGVFYALSCLVNAIFVLPVMIVVSLGIDVFGSSAYKKKRTVLDWMVHYWAKMVLLSSGCNPRIYGLENLPPSGEPVIYIPNHTSFMDILTLSGFVPKPFKYLSKEEIVKIPIIGYAMKLGQHVFLKRNDLESTIQVTNTVIEKLEDGNGMVLFAEGTRSKDGVLKQFKKGAFQMAKAAKVRIVPLSIGNLHRFMPPSALMPIAPLRNIYIKIHPAISSDNKSVAELRAETWEAVNSGLPPYQQGVLSARTQKKLAAEQEQEQD
jgi:1-acyl-sn-glycerol-3-phosphate acyltransferase